MDGAVAVLPTQTLTADADVGGRGTGRFLEGSAAPSGTLPPGRADRPSLQYWLPASILALGILAAVVLVWTHHFDGGKGESRYTLSAVLGGWAVGAALLALGAFRQERGWHEANAGLRALNVSLSRNLETQRTKFMSDLHDHLGHALVLVKLGIHGFSRAAATDPAAAREHGETLTRLIDGALEDIRSLARDVGRSPLGTVGFTVALRCLAESFDRETLVVRAQVADVDARLPDATQRVVYRIVQQALTNAARHADARNIALRVEGEGQDVVFVVEDDGRGFTSRQADAQREAGAMGLATMRERAASIGGSLEIRSVPGEGTRIALRVSALKPEEKP